MCHLFTVENSVITLKMTASKSSFQNFHRAYFNAQIFLISTNTAILKRSEVSYGFANSDRNLSIYLPLCICVCASVRLYMCIRYNI